MIEVRPLNGQELDSLIKTAPESETRFIRNSCKVLEMTPFKFFEKCAQEQCGIVINNRPIYQGSIIDGEFWTVVNSDVKEQFTLYKVAKRKAFEWASKHGPLTAKMYKDNEKNLRWTERIGFKRIAEDENTVTLKLEV